jgi:hypothetical protein
MMVNHDARLIVSQHLGLQLELELMMTIRHDQLRASSWERTDSAAG